MNWEWINWIGEDLNPDTLRVVRGDFTSMSIWMQTLLFGMLILLAGCCLVECLFAFRMNAGARFLTGFATGFFVCFLILHEQTAVNEISMVLYSLIAGTAGGLLYAFAVRVYRLVTGASFGMALAPWLIGQVFSTDMNTQAGGVWALVIIAASAALFAVLAKRFSVILSAVTGGTILSLILETFVTYDQVPYIYENIDIPEEMYWNLAAVVLIVIGIIVQGSQYISADRKKKKEQALAEAQALAHRSRLSEENGSGTDEKNGSGAGVSADGKGSTDGIAITSGGNVDGDGPDAGIAGGPDSGDAEDVIEDAEAVLVEKARELAAAAAKSGEKARRLDRYADVADGLYSPAVAADRLGITEEKFIDDMRAAGYEVPAPEKKEEKSSEDEGPAPEIYEKRSDDGTVNTDNTADTEDADTKPEEALASEDGDTSSGTGEDVQAAEKDEEDAAGEKPAIDKADGEQ